MGRLTPPPAPSNVASWSEGAISRRELAPSPTLAAQAASTVSFNSSRWGWLPALSLIGAIGLLLI